MVTPAAKRTATADLGWGACTWPGLQTRSISFRPSAGLSRQHRTQSVLRVALVALELDELATCDLPVHEVGVHLAGGREVRRARGAVVVDRFVLVQPLGRLLEVLDQRSDQLLLKSP